VVPYDSPQIKMARFGDVVGIQHLFSTGQASPFDRNLYGSTLLDVGCSPVEQNYRSGLTEVE
jgi:hypothetical protein